MTRAVSIAQSGANNVTMRNKIINGAMMIDQRNAGASYSQINGGYSLDRWAGFSYAGGSVTGKYTVQQNAGSVTPPAGFTNYLGVTSSAATSLASTDIFTVNQTVEGYNVADLNWGTANAKTITISFWVRASIAGTYGILLRNDGGNRAYSTTYTISSTNTWEQKTVTIPGDQSGTWLATNGAGIIVLFQLQVGSTYTVAPNSWGAGNLYGSTGCVSLLATSGATWQVTGVQLEAGTTATPFEQRLYVTELALCQRYCQVVSGGTIAFASTTSGYAAIAFPTAMRAAPSLPTILGTVYWANMVGTNAGVTGSPTWSFYGSPNSYGANLSMTFNAANASPVSAGQVGTSYVLNAAYGFLFSAEL